MKCSNCKQQGHTKRSCVEQPIKGPDGLTTKEFNLPHIDNIYLKKCSLCGRVNHDKNSCYLNKRPDNVKNGIGPQTRAEAGFWWK
jgi:hypothetical protein